MPSHEDYVKVLQLLVVAVDRYPLVDPNWRQVRTRKAIEERSRMIESANRVMRLMQERPLTQAERDAIFWDGDVPAPIDFTDQKWREGRLDRNMKVSLLQHLVYEVYDYRSVDPKWTNVADTRAGAAQTRMEEYARRVMFQMCGETLTYDDITTVFWTE